MNGQTINNKKAKSMSHAVAIANNNNAARQSFDRINGNNKKANSMSAAVASANNNAALQPFPTSCTS